jgi:hypothetical protein
MLTNFQSEHLSYLKKENTNNIFLQHKHFLYIKNKKIQKIEK